MRAKAGLSLLTLDSRGKETSQAVLPIGIKTLSGALELLVWWNHFITAQLAGRGAAFDCGGTVVLCL